MSTRSRIGLKLEDGTVKSVYCHSDGYPDGVGKYLERMTSIKVIDDYLEEGDRTTADMSYKEWRNEDCPAQISINEKIYFSENWGVSYVYLFSDGKWVHQRGQY